MDLAILMVIVFVAALVNGAIGYGFSSITVPLALLIVTNRALNPALVLIEVVLNAWVLWINRDALPRVWRRSLPILIGLVPGVAFGTSILARLSGDWIRFGTFLVLLPLILLQVAGIRRPIRSERVAGVGFGAGLGTLYAVTTVSGPPLAAFLNNQGFAQRDFRAALGLIRITEAILTAAAYAGAGLIGAGSASLALALAPGIALGVPIGAWLIRRIDAEVFRRACMTFDAIVVSFGLSMLLRAMHVVESAWSWAPFALVVATNAVLLARFARSRTTAFLESTAQ